MADVNAVVAGVDTYRWVDTDGNVQSADRGAEIKVTADEFDRVPGALSKPGDKADEGTDALGYPTDHESLDALAVANDFNFAQHTSTVPEKLKELTEAQIDPASAPKKRSSKSSS